MIIPAVQNPHWKPCSARNARCTGLSGASPASAASDSPGAWSGPVTACCAAARPSIVVTSASAARNAGKMQLCTGTPSTCTVHAPQSPASQPFLTPNQPCSRR